MENKVLALAVSLNEELFDRYVHRADQAVDQSFTALKAVAEQAGDSRYQGYPCLFLNMHEHRNKDNGDKSGQHIRWRFQTAGGYQADDGTWHSENSSVNRATRSSSYQLLQHLSPTTEADFKGALTTKDYDFNPVPYAVVAADMDRQLVVPLREIRHHTGYSLKCLSDLMEKNYPSLSSETVGHLLAKAAGYALKTASPGFPPPPISYKCYPAHSDLVQIYLAGRRFVPSDHPSDHTSISSWFHQASKVEKAEYLSTLHSRQIYDCLRRIHLSEKSALEKFMSNLADSWLYVADLIRHALQEEFDTSLSGPFLFPVVDHQKYGRPIVKFQCFPIRSNSDVPEPVDIQVSNRALGTERRPSILGQLRSVQEVRSQPNPEPEDVDRIRQFVAKVAYRAAVDPHSPECLALLEEFFNYDLDNRKEKVSGKGLNLTGKTLPGECAYLFRVDYRQRDFHDYVEPWEARLAAEFSKTCFGKLGYLSFTNDHLLEGASTCRPTEDIVYDPPDIKAIVRDS